MIGYIHNRRLNPKSINCILTGLRKFYDFLYYEGKIKIANPVRPEYRQCEPKPLPRFLRDEEIEMLIDSIKNKRDIVRFQMKKLEGTILRQLSW